MVWTPSDYINLGIGITAAGIGIWSLLRTRVKGPRFIVFDFHITNIKDAKRDGKKLVLITSTSTILNQGDQIGHVRFKRAELKGHLKGSEDNKAFELKQPEHTEPRSFSLDAGIATTAGFNFETENLAMKNGWEKAKLTVEGSYRAKRKTKEFILEFIGSSEKKKMWESPNKRKEKTIVSI